MNFLIEKRENMKKMKLKKEVKQIILTTLLGLAFYIIYKMLGSVGYLAVESRTYASLIILGWILLFGITSLIMHIIWER